MINRNRLNRKGITLLELLVGIVIGGSVMGMILWIFILTNRQVKQQSLDARSVSEAAAIASQVDRIFESFSDEKVLLDQFGSQLNFASGTLTVFDATGKIFTISNSENSVDLKTVQKDQKEKNRSLSLNTDLFSSSIKFEYASEFDNNLQPNLKNKSSKNDIPSYVRYTIEVKSIDNPDYRPAILISGVAL